MSDDNDVSSCEYCDRRTSCSNIYVALKILESEMHYCEHSVLRESFSHLNRKIRQMGYSFPDKIGHCVLETDRALADGLLRELTELLTEVRAYNKIA